MNKKYKITTKINGAYSSFLTSSALKALIYYKRLNKHGFNSLILMKNKKGNIRKISESRLEKEVSTYEF